MQTTSELYKILLNTHTTSADWKVIINDGEEIDKSGIWDGQITGRLFSTGSPTVGGCVARELSITLIPRGVEIPRMAKLTIKYALTDGIDKSEWISLGSFFVDTRQWNAQHDIVAIHAYDAMLKAEEDYLIAGQASGTWPRAQTAVVQEIAQRIGVPLDPRTVINSGYMAEYPGGYSMREVLGFVGGCHCGNWIITPQETLLLLPLVVADPYIHQVGDEVAEFENAPEFAPWTKVQFYFESKNTYGAGTNSGRTLEIENPWATQAIANSCLAVINGHVYKPFTAGYATLDPAAELGDYANVNGITSIIAEHTMRFGSVWKADIAAPSEAEIDHEFPYKSKAQRQTQREIAKLSASLTVGLGEIEARVTDVEGDITYLELTAEEIEARVQDNEGNIAQLEIDAKSLGARVEDNEGDIAQLIMDSGQVSVSVTDSKGTLNTTIDASTWQAVYKLITGEVKSGFYFDFGLGRFVYDGTGIYRSEDGSAYIQIENDGILVYADDGTGDVAKKMHIGFNLSGGVAYPYVLMGAPENVGEAGIVKKFSNGLFIGNGYAAAASGAFNPTSNYTGIFVNTKVGKTYVVNGTDMQNVYTGEAIAKFA